MTRAALPAAAYVAIVFAIGAIIGPVREFVLTPIVGKLAAVLIESPIILIASAIAAWRIIRWRPDASPVWLGVLSLTMLLVVELAGSIWPRGMTSNEYLLHLATPEGLTSLFLFGGFALMPAVLSRLRGQASSCRLPASVSH